MYHNHSTRTKMLEELVKDYAAYFRLDVSTGFQTVQDVIDNMLTRLEELTSVLSMIKLKNSDCCLSGTENISKYRKEITTLSRKVATINEVLRQLHDNIDLLEKQVEKAELDFGVNNDNKLVSFLKPLLRRSRDTVPVASAVRPPTGRDFQSVLHNFKD